MEWHWGTAALMAVVGALGGLLVPALVARIPEPVDEDTEVDEADTTAPDLSTGLSPAVAPDTVVEDPKELYAEIAGRPGLGLRSAVATALVAGLAGGALGPGGDLLLLAYLAPVGVALAVVDWRTRLLPTWVIGPSYGVVVVVVVMLALLTGETGDLLRAGWGWVLAGGTYLLLWLVYPRGLGFGDVRLAGVLGLALGHVGWTALLVGVWAGFLLGGVVGGLLGLLRLVDRKAYPFGPFMLLGALVGVLVADPVTAFYTVR